MLIASRPGSRDASVPWNLPRNLKLVMPSNAPEFSTHLTAAQVIDCVLARGADWPGGNLTDLHLAECALCTAAIAEAATAIHVASALRACTVWPRIGLSAADAATWDLSDGQQADLSWFVSEGEFGNVNIRFGSKNIELVGSALRLWPNDKGLERELSLKLIDTGASLQVGAETWVTRQERGRLDHTKGELRVELVKKTASGFEHWPEYEWAADVYTQRYKLLAPLIRRRIFGVRGDWEVRDLVDDFVAECFEGILRNWTPSRPFWPFVRTALYNFCTKRGMKLQATPQESLDALMETGFEPGPTSDTFAIDVDIGNLLSLLPLRERECLILLHVVGTTSSKAAEIMCAPEGSVKAWAFFGLHSLRALVNLNDSDAEIVRGAIRKLAEGQRVCVCGGSAGADIRRRLEQLSKDPRFAVEQPEILKTLSRLRGLETAGT